MEANPKKLLDELIPEALGKQFVIPVYQRKYTWTVKKQLVTLMEDLQTLLDDKTLQRQHFLGTIVYYEKLTNFKVEKLIVDGQQRLVTMFLIAHAMKSLAPNEFKKREIDETYLQNFAEEATTKYRQRLYTSVTDGEEYRLIAEDRYDEINKSSGSNIIRNFLFFQKEFKQLLEVYEFDHLMYALKQFSVVYIKLDENDNAQQIFESINSTGERLTASDLIRNFIMMDKSNEDQTAFYHNYWQKIENVFPDAKEMEDFFRFYLAAIQYEYSAKNVLYQTFKAYWTKAKKQTTEIALLEQIVRYANYFNNIYNVPCVGEYQEIISDFRNIESTMSVPFALGVSEWYYHEKQFDEATYYEIIRILNILQIRRHFNGNASNHISNRFPSFLRNVTKYVETKGFENIIDIVTYVLITKNQGSNMAIPTDKMLNGHMSSVNAYNMNMVRWLLEKIENRNNKAKLDMRNLSIDHVMPQTITPYWEEKAGLNGEDYISLVNTIGNLTLVTKSDNSAAGNRDFDNKKVILQDTLHIHMNQAICAKDEWTIEEIEQRTQAIIAELISMYPYLSSTGNYTEEENRQIFLSKPGIKAEGYFNDDATVVVYQGSGVRSITCKSDNFKDEREELIASGVIADVNGELVFTQDYMIRSISKATGIILGHSCSGWDYWTNIDGVILNKSSLKDKISA